MRILLVTPVPPARHGPGAIPALLHAALVGLTEHNDVTVVTAPGPESWELEAMSALREQGFDVRGVRRHLDGGARRWSRRARLAGAWLRGRDPWRTIWYHEPRLQHVLDVTLDAERFDVVAVEDNSMATYRFVTEAPVVLTEHEVRAQSAVDVPEARSSSRVRRTWSQLDTRRWVPYERRVWSRFDKIQVFTEPDARAASTIAPDLADRFAVNPFGIELPDLGTDVPVEGRTIGFVGNFSHLPNVEAAVFLARKIMPPVWRRWPDARLRIAGSQVPDAVCALARPGVELAGFQDDVERFMRGCAVLAAPVRSGGGMRMKVLHGMALGRPVVTTTLGAAGIAVGGTAIPLEVADGAESSASALCGLLGDDRARQDLGQRARRHIEQHFSPGAYAARLEDVYRTARRAGPRRAAGGTDP